MTRFTQFFADRLAWVPVLLVALVAGCGGGQDPVLGSPSIGVSPSVTANAGVTTTFNKPMAAAMLTPTGFTLACPAATPMAAAVTYDATTQTATLTPGQALPPSTACGASLTKAAQDSTAIAPASRFAGGYMTGAWVETTRPTVLLTAPAADAVNAPTNTKIAATFSDDIAAATFSASSFTVTNITLGTAVAGRVSYAAGARTAVFTPTSPATLAVNNTFSATLTTAVTDLAGNGLAANHVWRFAAGATGDASLPTVTNLSPPDGDTGVCLGRAVSATFSEAMDAATISSTTFGVIDNGMAVAGTVSYDAPSQTASFVASNTAGLAAGRAYVVTVWSGSTGVKDQAGNALAVDRVWSFSTGAQPCTSAVNLSSAALVGVFGGGAGVTNQGVNTVVNGKRATSAASTLVTGLHDAANGYTGIPPDIGAVEGGDTDRLGSTGYHQRLSEQRAEAVTKQEHRAGGKPNPTLMACLQPDRRVDVEVVGAR